MKTTLTDRAVRAAKHDISDAVVPGFMLRVRPSGAKSYALLARFPGSNNPTRRTIAAVGAISLAGARETARSWLALLARGIDPADELQRERDVAALKRHDTIAAVAERYLRRYVPNLRTADRITYYFRDVLIPLFGHRPITELTWKEVSLALDAIAELGTDHGLIKLGAREQLQRRNHRPKPAPISARNLFITFDGLLRWAAGTGEYDIQASPLARVDKAKRFGEIPRRSRYLDDAEIGAVWRASGFLLSPYRQFYRMLMLTGLRLSEVREAQWNEFNFEAKKWTVPASRMKGRQSKASEHVVPLTSHMLTALQELARGARGPFVFSINRGASPIARSMKAKPSLDKAMAAEMGNDTKHFVNHDFRRTLSTHAGDIGIEPIVVEKMLAHTLPGVGGIYNRNQYLDQRREGHEKWGEFLLKCAGERGKVVRMQWQSSGDRSRV